jgi:hypothetical protein
LWYDSGIKESGLGYHGELGIGERERRREKEREREKESEGEKERKRAREGEGKRAREGEGKREREEGREGESEREGDRSTLITLTTFSSLRWWQTTAPVPVVRLSVIMFNVYFS